MALLIFVGNQAKGRIWKRVFQENKALQIFRKGNISYPLIRTRMIRTYVYQGVRNVRFSENLAYFVFLKYSFWVSLFCLITDVLNDCNLRKQFSVVINFVILCFITSLKIRRKSVLILLLTAAHNSGTDLNGKTLCPVWVQSKQFLVKVRTSLNSEIQKY